MEHFGMGASDPSETLKQYIGQTIYTALESARLGYITDAYMATGIATENIMNAVYAQRPAIKPEPGRRARNER